MFSILRRKYHTVRRILSNNGLDGLTKAVITELFPSLAMKLVQKPKLNFNSQPPEKTSLFDNALVSIVIPVFNNIEITLQCINSIEQANNSIPYKIIVVDDFSTDNSYAVLDKIANIDVIKNDTNLGFIQSCNAAFNEINTTYTLILNNDTYVLDHWLDTLVSTFSKHSNVGLVGSKLIYPNGLLQEAGGLIWNDASGHNFGKGLNPEHPNFNYLRDVSYCSGACILLETSLLKSVNGFDTRFIPAYYEDTDLAFQVRAKGKRVLYQPQSIVVHHEGVSNGTSTDSGIKKYQLDNQIKFFEKWKQTLSNYPISTPDPTLNELHPNAKGHILVISSRIPDATKDSGSFRMNYMLKILLQLGYSVSFLPDNMNGLGSAADELRFMGIKVICAPFFTPKDYIRCHANEYDFIFLSHNDVAQRNLKYLLKYAPNKCRIFDTVDLAHIRLDREAKLINSNTLSNKAELIKNQEISIINSCQHTIVVSQYEKEYLEKLLPSANIHIISNIHTIIRTKTEYSKRNNLLFIGGFGHPPNIDAVNFLAHTIMPKIIEDNPEILLYVVGSETPKEIKQLETENIKIMGYVKDLEPLLNKCLLSVAPLRFGAGVKGKINLSMSRGLPVVATTIAAEGMGLLNGHDVLIADSPEEFAAHITTLHKNKELWEIISNNSYKNIESNFSIECAKNNIEQLLAEVGT